MNITNQYTLYTGAESSFPLVLRAVHARLPNLYPILDVASDLNATRLQRASRWHYHVLQQMTFSYLSSDYLKSTVLTALDELPDAQSLQTLLPLRQQVHDLASGRLPLTMSSVAALNDVAYALQQEVLAKRLEIIVEAMNAIGRYGCGRAAGSNPSRTQKYFNLLTLALVDHCGEVYLCRRIREKFSFRDYSDESGFRREVISALTSLRDDLARAATHVCIFHCPDIKLAAENFSLGDVTFVRSSDPRLEALVTSSGTALQWVAERRNDWEAMAIVQASSHPEAPHTGLAKAAAVLDEICGEFVSQEGGFAPPRQYAGIVPDGTPTYAFCEVSATAGSSVFMIRPGDPERLTRLHGYVASATSSPVEAALQERFRRSLRTIRRAAFLAHCGEYSQAFASAWQVLEAIFGGIESRERGHAIARRVSTMVVMPDGERADEQYPVGEADLIQFAKEYLASPSGPPAGSDMANLLSLVSNLAPGDPNLAFYQLLLRDLNDELMNWHDARRITQLAQRSPDEARVRLLARRIELKDRLEEHYKLRNDIVHAGYDDPGVAEVMYRELARLLGSFIFNLAYNCSLKQTYSSLLQSLDEEWQRGWPVSNARSADDESRLSVAAYYRWIERGRPIGDDWADWFAAETVEAV